MSVGESYSRLKDDADALLHAAKSVRSAYGDNLYAARRLLQADMALAKTALLRGLVFLLVCTMLAGTGWVMLMVILVFAIHQLGLGWLGALLVAFALCIGLALLAWRLARKALVYADFDASRRQIARWFSPDPASAVDADQPLPTPPSAGRPDTQAARSDAYVVPPTDANPEP